MPRIPYVQNKFPFYGNGFSLFHIRADNQLFCEVGAEGGGGESKLLFVCLIFWCSRFVALWSIWLCLNKYVPCIEIKAFQRLIWRSFLHDKYYVVGLGESK